MSFQQDQVFLSLAQDREELEATIFASLCQVDASLLGLGGGGGGPEELGGGGFR